ncbi:MAG: glycosyltransferase family protein [Myxococcota bacterium]
MELFRANSTLVDEHRPIELVAGGLGGDERYLVKKAAKGLRVAVYSHDTVGLGHLRRNMLIAETLLTAGSATNVLLLTGVSEASRFRKPEGADFLTVPSFQKQTNRYESRSLDITTDELVQLRSMSICAALKAFRPDVFIVDKVPRGALGELTPVLEELRSRGRTRCVLGLRDVLDEPEHVRTEWVSSASEAAIEAFYDAIWVYGDRAVYDPVREYGLSERVAEKVRFAGYLNRRDLSDSAWDPPSSGETVVPPGRFVLCTVGGGEDGEALIRAFAQASLPAHTSGVILAGPFMPRRARDAIARLVASRSDLRLLDFVNDPDALLGAADRVIAMGGYNTVCEILAHEKRALIVPRVSPRTEQLIRARRLAALGLLSFCHPSDATPAALEKWMASDVSTPSPHGSVDLGAVARLPGLIGELRLPGEHAARPEAL